MLNTVIQTNKPATNNKPFASTAKLLEEVILYCKTFSQHIGHQVTENTIQVSALTGSAACEIGGDTAHRIFGLNNRNDSAPLNKIDLFRDTRINIVDEISFADYDRDLTKLSHNLQAYTECREHQFGKCAIVFLGDFCQLPPVGDNCIYHHPHGIYWEQALTNMVELKGTHRYHNCNHMQRIMPELRNTGTLTETDWKLLNSRVVNGRDVKLPNLQKARFASHSNKQRCKINAGIFYDYLKKHHSNSHSENVPSTAIVIKADAVWARSKRKLSYQHRKALFEQCCEADITNGQSKRADPFLCLFSGCHVMYTKNDNVKKGIANGVTATFEKAILKPGKCPTPSQVAGFWVNTIDVNDVDCLLLKWHDCRFEGTFKIRPHENAYQVKFPIVEFGEQMTIQTKIQLTHFDIVINHCTTGHKLQGKSLDQLVISEWNRTQNWAYVVLSRVRTLKGLFLLKPIPTNINFAPDPQYLGMMERLRSTILASSDDVSDLMIQIDTNQFN